MAPASYKQKEFIRDIAERLNVPLPDLKVLTSLGAASWINAHIHEFNEAKKNGEFGIEGDDD